MLERGGRREGKRETDVRLGERSTPVSSQLENIKERL